MFAAIVPSRHLSLARLLLSVLVLVLEVVLVLEAVLLQGLGFGVAALPVHPRRLDSAFGTTPPTPARRTWDCLPLACAGETWLGPAAPTAEHRKCAAAPPLHAASPDAAATSCRGHRPDAVGAAGWPAGWPAGWSRKGLGFRVSALANSPSGTGRLSEQSSMVSLPNVPGVERYFKRTAWGHHSPPKEQVGRFQKESNDTAFALVL
mmetsp:Transcript_3861/g.12133  ORF Transcript_3861/g.12133 Transcript_3861/m.12133 type:complete len:206 (-) Transcript_3861:950-1567(-)